MIDKWEKATRRLAALTESQELSWEDDHFATELRLQGPPLIGAVYVAETNGKRIAVFEQQRFSTTDDGDVVTIGGTNVIIEFVNQQGEAEWRWPSPDSRFELLESIRYQRSNAEQFLEGFLSSN